MISCSSTEAHTCCSRRVTTVSFLHVKLNFVSPDSVMRETPVNCVATKDGSPNSSRFRKSGQGRSRQRRLSPLSTGEVSWGGNSQATTTILWLAPSFRAVASVYPRDRSPRHKNRAVGTRCIHASARTPHVLGILQLCYSDWEAQAAQQYQHSRSARACSPSSRLIRAA